MVMNEARRLARATERSRSPRRVRQRRRTAARTVPRRRAVVAALPPRQREVVFLRYYADLEYRTIAEVLEIEQGTVAATLSKAHQALRDRLEGARR